MTHGFPKHRASVFRSTNFHIENRPGLEDQSIEGVIKELAKLNAPEITSEKGGDRSRKLVLAEWISDWHLVAFLATTQLFSPEDTKTLIKVASSPNLLDDLSILDNLLHTEGWQTLMTFTKEMGCRWPRLGITYGTNASSVSAPARPTSFPAGPSGGMDEDIPPEIFDQIRESEMASGASSRIRICQFCTFENTGDGTDCEVCGLPL